MTWQPIETAPIFGAFTETDTFVGLTLRQRKDLKTDALFSESIVEALMV